MSRKWLAERRNDYYHRLAKKLGYRSRAAFKLKQLNERFGFFRGAKYVLDLGAAPGGWLQVAVEEVGEDGFVLGVDIKAISPLDSENVETIVGDITSPETLNKIKEKLKRPIDVVLSDVSPNVSGVWEIDHIKQIDLTEAAINITHEVLKPNGWVVLKVFQGREYNRFVDDVRRRFEFVRIVKPAASRKASAEVYIIAKGLKGAKGGQLVSKEVL